MSAVPPPQSPPKVVDVRIVDADIPLASMIRLALKFWGVGAAVGLLLYALIQVVESIREVF